MASSLSSHPIDAASPSEEATLAPIYAALATRFLDSFPVDLPTWGEGKRTVGRELEFPIVDADGRAADVRRLWNHLTAPGDLKIKYDTGTPNLIVEAAGADFSYTIEVGVGTMEINTRPCRSLLEVAEIAERGVARLVHAAARMGWRVLGYGIQPVTKPGLQIMTPKQRYQSLYRAMGAEWLWYTVTAADQTHVALARHEAIDLLNYGNLITPALIALCANSPVYEGKLSPWCSGREGGHSMIHANEHRHGMPVEPYADAHDFVRRVSQSVELIHKRDGEVIPTAQPFWRTLLDSGADYDAFLFHEHYLWNSARIRSAYGTVEVRPCCQQPWHEHMAASALILGLVEARTTVQPYIEAELGGNFWQVMRGWHQQAIRRGLATAPPVPNMLSQLVGMAGDALGRRGYGEEVLLAPIWRRLERRQNPAQRAAQLFRTDGMAALVNHATIRPASFR
jgi:gamma-glutamylcysteine synthetase